MKKIPSKVPAKLLTEEGLNTKLIPSETICPCCGSTSLENDESRKGTVYGSGKV